mmetsp:Transcript_80734/g.160379  ORF Transcript_80734/g.160379 Transcript_80734/m.160379 type:complete len:208 (+) Transcript_80734:47-670(+)
MCSTLSLHAGSHRRIGVTIAFAHHSSSLAVLFWFLFCFAGGGGDSDGDGASLSLLFFLPRLVPGGGGGSSSPRRARAQASSLALVALTCALLSCVRSSAVRPFLSRRDVSAPAAISALTAEGRPFAAASWSAVCSSGYTIASTCAPAVRSVITTFVCPWLADRWSARMSFSLVAARSAPNSSNAFTAASFPLYEASRRGVICCLSLA